MTRDRGRRSPSAPIAPVVLLALSAVVLLLGSGAPRSLDTALPAAHIAAPGGGHVRGLPLWTPRVQQPDRATGHDLPVATLGAGGLLVAAAVVSIAVRRRRRTATDFAFAPSSPRAPPARVGTS